MGNRPGYRLPIQGISGWCILPRAGHVIVGDDFRRQRGQAGGEDMGRPLKSDSRWNFARNRNVEG